MKSQIRTAQAADIMKPFDLCKQQSKNPNSI